MLSIAATGVGNVCLFVWWW